MNNMQLIRLDSFAIRLTYASQGLEICPGRAICNADGEATPRAHALSVRRVSYSTLKNVPRIKLKIRNAFRHNRDSHSSLRTPNNTSYICAFSRGKKCPQTQGLLGNSRTRSWSNSPTVNLQPMQSLLLKTKKTKDLSF